MTKSKTFSIGGKSPTLVISKIGIRRGQLSKELADKKSMFNEFKTIINKVRWANTGKLYRSALKLSDDDYDTLLDLLNRVIREAQ